MVNFVDPVYAKPTFLQWVRLVWRAIFWLAATLILVPLHVVFSLIEKVIPMNASHYITSAWGRTGLYVCGLKLEVVGEHMKQGGAVVPNHVSWIDIFTFHASSRLSFVAKAEVRKWPIIGLIAWATNTLFIERKTSHAKRHQVALLARLDRGQQLCFFPEGTSTDGRHVVRFKPTLFEVFHTPEMVDHAWVQPATATYFPPEGQSPIFYGWGGDMPFIQSIIGVVGLSSGGRVRVTLHDPVPASDYATRKELAKYCEEVVREGLAKDLGLTIEQVSQTSS